MPKTAVNKYDCFQSADNNIGFSGETLVVDAIAVSVAPQPFANHNLRLCVFALDLAHAKVPLFRCHDVSHVAKLEKRIEKRKSLLQLIKWLNASVFQFASLMPLTEA